MNDDDPDKTNVFSLDYYRYLKHIKPPKKSLAQRIREALEKFGSFKR